MSERVFIVGAGRVGQGLARAFRIAGVEIIGVHGKRAAPGATSHGVLPADIARANTVILAVRDDQIDAALDQVLGHGLHGAPEPLTSGTVILHTSGTAEPAALELVAGRGLGGGTFHPLVPFLDPERAPELLRGAWVGVDGNADARSTSRRLAGHVGARTIDIPAGGKPTYHAAAVFSANFPVVLAAIGAELMQSIGVPAKSSESAVHSLMTAALSNATGKSPAEALTGPVVRGDAGMVRKHLEALAGDDRALGVYRRLSLAALRIAKERGTDPVALVQIEKALLPGKTITR
ncbi:MAG: Rossmann-like and DUF2520 domain-containing protein [Gemmatimonadaceae bacterium]|jgi:predicted short-subunit dehydrogenase-like oxidoreductase (DUF2520 family)